MADGELSIMEAAGLMGVPASPPTLQDRPEPPQDTPSQPAEAPAADDSAEPQPETDSAEQADAGAAAEEAQPPSETEETDAPEETLPPIDPPRSWTKAEKEAFKALPRETQETLLNRERARDSDLSVRLREAAEQQKAAEARSAAAEQARQQYEAALPNLLNVLQQQINGEFADIKSWDDVNRMQEADPLRFQRWQLRTAQAQQLQAEVQQAQARQQTEQLSRFESYKKTETEKFLEAAPEYRDPKTAPQLQAAVQQMFSDVGITPDELRGMWNGRQGISIHDHRVQLLIRDAARYRAAKTGLKTATPKPAPPVQKPGIATNRGEVRATQLSQLDDRLTRSGSRQDALALLNAASGRRG